MVYDPVGARTILFGGLVLGDGDPCVGSLCQETWSYDGRWRRIDPTD